MMTQQAANYAKVLFSLGLSKESIENAVQLLLNNRELFDALDNPVVKLTEKEAVIDAIFTYEIRNFLKVLCANQKIRLIDKIFEEYENLVFDCKNITKAQLTYVVKPNETELEQIKDMICNKYKKAGVSLKLQEDASLIGGYELTVGNTVYDKSIKGTLLELQMALARR